MHKETINGCVDLLPDLKRYRCTLTKKHSGAFVLKVFAYGHDAFQAHSKASAYFQKTCSAFAQHPQEFNVQAFVD